LAPSELRNVQAPLLDPASNHPIPAFNRTNRPKAFQYSNAG
jgi:hypothetical protein